MFDVRVAMQHYPRDWYLTLDPPALTPDDAPINLQRARDLADLYQDLPHTPDEPRVYASYLALRQEIERQYQHLVNYGLRIEPWQGDGEPYAGSRDMLADLNAGHLYYLQTASAGSLPAVHPMRWPVVTSSNDRYMLTGLLALNDAFRAVHDAIGHGVSGSTFTARGEDLAFKTHKRTLTPAAHLALCCETRAQSYYVNFGRHLRRPDGTLPRKEDTDYTPLSARPFAPNKAVNLPAWAIED